MNSIAQSPNKINNEIWKDIPGYVGSYQASNYGRVRGLDRILENGRRWKGRVLAHKIDKYGYNYILLYSGGKRKSVQVQVIVMLAFVGPRPKDYETHHKDGNPSNNKLENLVYLSKKDHAKTKSKENIRGTNSHYAVLNEQQILEIRKLAILRKENGKKMYTQTQIAKIFNTSQTHISSIVLRKIWAWL